MRISDEVLMAYADGEVDSKTRALVEEAIASDPQVARRIAEHKALRGKLRSSYDEVLDEPIPERLLAAARGRSSSQERGFGGAAWRGAEREMPDDGGAKDGGGAKDQWRSEGQGRSDSGGAKDNRGVAGRGVVVPLRPRRARTPSMTYWGAIAASFVVGAVVWHFAAELLLPGPVIERNGQLLASGALDKALSTQLVKDQQIQSAAQIGVSFRSKAGNYCRTFQLQDGNLAGLACREQGNWKLEVLAQAGPSPAGHPEFRQAGSSLPPAIAQAVDQAIDGEPLDAQGEAQARTNQWRSGSQ
jgi:anti-sigma factor RsiW